MIAPMIIFAFVVYLLVSNNSPADRDYEGAALFQTIIIAMVPGGLLAGYFFFKAKVARMTPSLPLESRLRQYLTLVLIRSALFEVPFFFCCVATFITGEILFLSATPVILFIFVLLRPNAGSIAEDLRLTSSERKEIES